ncbi:MAG: DUF2934 domain-containing protein [Acidobacteriota bacterium]|jgi:hypothetical protein|nr:DUF2934 domain-containing protein [Acidobacteriota bacterium]
MARAKTPRSISPSPATPLNNPVITMPDNSSVSQAKKSTSVGNSSQLDLNGEIRNRAYELYEERGCTPGHEYEDWLTAEREVLARRNRQQSA